MKKQIERRAVNTRPLTGRSLLVRSLACLGICMATTPAMAEEAAAQVKLAPVTVVGEHQERLERPGSAHVVTEQELRAQNYDNIDQALRRVPGVYFRQEDGFGLFPNISLRGTDTTRSAKITVMEDGVMIAPAPYSAPAAYFSPATGRMSSIEILKGSSQVKYGPHITGGVLNYQSTQIPLKQRAYLRSTYGEFGDFRAHGFVGNTLDTEWGRFGYVLEGYFRRNDGFKKIDKTPDFRNSGDTGFTRFEPMVKLSFEPKTDLYQHFEFKFGYTSLDADETYLGLADADFRNSPYRRYAASRFDNITTEQFRSHLRHFIAPTDNLDVTTTFYYTDFSRNWFKLHDLRNVPGAGNMNLSRAVAGANGGAGLACLKGELECTLRLRNNNRDYATQGVESVANYRFNTGQVAHHVTGGVRYHYDKERRFQRDELFFQAANGTIFDHNPGQPGDAGNSKDSVDALAFHMQDRIRWGRWQFIPGIRYERLWLNHENFSNQANSGRASLDLFAGGLGVVYDLSEEWKLIGGAHRGFSPPNPQSAVVSKLKEETSTGFEWGTRYLGMNGALSAEAIGFLTLFDDLIVVNNIGGAGTGLADNLGKAQSLGVEFSTTFDAGMANNWGFSNPYFFTFTYTDATQRSNARSTDAESIFSFGEKGNKIPYIPEYQLTTGTSIEFAEWGFNFTASYIGATYTSASNVTTQVDGNGNPDARFGKTDSYWLLDMGAHYQVKRGIKILAGVHNLLDEKYISSRQPHGPRPGAPRMAYAGFELNF